MCKYENVIRLADVFVNEKGEQVTSRHFSHFHVITYSN